MNNQKYIQIKKRLDEIEERAEQHKKVIDNNIYDAMTTEELLELAEGRGVTSKQRVREIFENAQNRLMINGSK